MLLAIVMRTDAVICCWHIEFTKSGCEKVPIFAGKGEPQHEARHPCRNALMAIEPRLQHWGIKRWFNRLLTMEQAPLKKLGLITRPVAYSEALTKAGQTPSLRLFW